MSNSKNEFIELCLGHNILEFGAFTLKSGRTSPYFFNAGLFNNGYLISQLAKHYARLIIDNIDSEYMLYGPAYKGIPLVTGTALQLSQLNNRNVGYTFNRKETKDHGEGGHLVGVTLTGEVLIIDDVITAGTSVRESVDIIRRAGATPHAVIIALDRQEVADDETLSAVQKVELEFGIPVYSLIKLSDLIQFLAGNTAFNEHSKAVIAYREKYGYKS